MDQRRFGIRHGRPYVHPPHSIQLCLAIDFWRNALSPDCCKELGFRGDLYRRLEHERVLQHALAGEFEFAAFQAGNDIFLCPKMHTKVETLLQAVNDSVIRQEEVDRRVRKILMAKYWCSLSTRPLVDT